MKNIKYTSSKQLYEKANEYFEKETLPTLAGLVIHLGFESKELFLSLKKDEKLGFSINLCLLRLEDINSRALYDKTLSSGAKFILENELKENSPSMKEEKIIVSLKE